MELKIRFIALYIGPCSYKKKTMLSFTDVFQMINSGYFLHRMYTSTNLLHNSLYRTSVNNQCKDEKYQNILLRFYRINIFYMYSLILHLCILAGFIAFLPKSFMRYDIFKREISILISGRRLG